jgi:hypothetical protein
MRSLALHQGDRLIASRKSGRYCTRVAAMILAGTAYTLAAAPSALENSHLLARHAPSRRWVIPGALVVAALVVGLAITSAYANTYAIDNGPSAPLPNIEPGPWTVFGSPQRAKITWDEGAAGYLAPRGDMNPDSSAGVQVNVPSGSAITIREAEVWWYVPQQSGGATTYALAAANGSVVEEANTPWFMAANRMPLPLGTTQLVLADYCSNSDYGSGCSVSGEANDLQLFGAQLILEDDTLPIGRVTGGVLAGSGTISGTEALAYSAEDNNSGIRAVQLIVDGVSVAENNYSAECPYTNFAACQTFESDTISWNTADVSNGQHEVALRITSAAGDIKTIDDHSVTVDNQPIQANSSTITGTAGNNTSTSLQAHIANGDPCISPVLELRFNGKRNLTAVTFGTPITVKGVLHCGTVPIAAAQVAISTVGGSAGSAIATSVRTGADGSFSYVVPTGPNRRLQFSYTPYSDDSVPSATATAVIAIRPHIVLLINKHRTSNGRTIQWKGMIAGGPYPHNGITLDVEVREGNNQWLLFHQIVTEGDGRFHYSYKFHATTEPTTYPFRVALPDNGSAGYPYAAGPSNTVDVHVRP